MPRDLPRPVWTALWAILGFGLILSGFRFLGAVVDLVTGHWRVAFVGIVWGGGMVAIQAFLFLHLWRVRGERRRTARREGAP